MKQIDKNFYPNWVRKAITFTIDDGNLRLDKKFMGYVKPAGICGTFNLCGNHPVSDIFPALYDGYEIANHCYRHPHALNEERLPLVQQELFNKDTAKDEYIYPSEEKGVYMKKQPYGWTVLADDDKYIELAEYAENNLVSIFGRDRVKGFVWPYGDQKNPALTERLIAMGFQSLRVTGNVGDKTGFALPADRMRWSYNANCNNMTECAEQYENYPDDGTLKFFCFGVHSHDFENAGKWDVLEDFCNKMGCRPETYWYACVGEIFDYRDATEKLTVTETAVENPTDIDLYITVDGKRMIVPKHSSVNI